ncbi:hypothetical protein ACLRE7_02500 [Mycoplasmopsis meleagridis]|uniref:hypothetical protein n=1 Tax=Mycoplasmopsis meleagridis TaxID=29561 RepID=UPI003A85A4E4
MNEKKSFVLDLFIHAIKTSPGIKEIIGLEENYDKDKKEDKLNVEYINNAWDLSVSLIILKNANCKDILNSISSLLNYRFKQEKLKLGKINIYIEGISND